ncbi:uncharacterized protein LOC131037054 isoform X2 [Cryptomeria japonica]|uniref:uncharacterized protein LOC131037054 isoform X2 n=1 Tax=Cryptomeria japonica TaxID=3369 RepID=UPI0025ABAE37|nr:uncharacterized protein LOC131037054 isoform X2 [Cryptomeria japonica]
MAGRRCIDLFHKLDHISKMPSILPYSNTQLAPVQNLMGMYTQPRIRLGGNANYIVQYMSSKISARLMQVHQVLEEAQARAEHANEPVPKLTLEHVTVGFARSGGAGGQNVNKVSTKVDMRFNVMGASWLPLRVREKILQMEKNRINSEGEIVISSTKTRSQKDNINDALGKLQAIINAAAYVPPAPTDEKIKKITKLSWRAEKIAI